MKWILQFFSSSIGKKLIMSLTGLFLISFLIVHLAGNLQLLKNDGGEAFNSYAYLMTHNPFIKVISYGTYFFILLHAVLGILLALANRKAKSTQYAVKPKDTASWASKNMAWLGSLILVFIFIHMGDFWYKMHWDQLQMQDSQGLGHNVADLYQRVSVAFEQWWIVLFYVIGMLGLGFHLHHGFQSAFQSLGLNHKKYTPFIQFFGKAFSILVAIGFAIIPIYMYFK